MARTRLHPNEETVVIEARVPASVREFLREYGHGNLSKGIRTLVKEAQWEAEGRVFDFGETETDAE